MKDIDGIPTQGTARSRIPLECIMSFNIDEKKGETQRKQEKARLNLAREKGERRNLLERAEEVGSSRCIAMGATSMSTWLNTTACIYKKPSVNASSKLIMYQDLALSARSALVLSRGTRAGPAGHAASLQLPRTGPGRPRRLGRGCRMPAAPARAIRRKPACPLPAGASRTPAP